MIYNYKQMLSKFNEFECAHTKNYFIVHESFNAGIESSFIQQCLILDCYNQFPFYTIHGVCYSDKMNKADGFVLLTY